jgi:hypothetical protein
MSEPVLEKPAVNKKALAAAAAVGVVVLVLIFGLFGGGRGGAAGGGKAATPAPTCYVWFTTAECREAACVVSIKIDARREGVIRAYADGVPQRDFAVRPGLQTYSVEAPYNSTLALRGVCNANYTIPPLRYSISAALELYDFDTGRYRARVDLMTDPPLRARGRAGDEYVYISGPRAGFAVWGSGPLRIEIGPIRETLQINPPIFNFTASAYKRGASYVYVVDYTASAAVKIGGKTLAAGSGSWTEQGPWKEKYCLGQLCAPVRYLQPRVEAMVEGLYYVYYFPVVMINITNYGPGDWEGVVSFSGPTKLYEQVGASIVYHTPFGDVAIRSEADSLAALLASLKAEYKTLPFRTSLPPGSYIFAVTPLGPLRLSLGNTTIYVDTPPTPRLELRDVSCGERYIAAPVELSTRYAFATANFTGLRAWAVAEKTCNATIAVFTNGYTIVDPLVVLKSPHMAVFYRLKATVTSDAVLTLYDMSYPTAVATDNGAFFEKLGYTCRALNYSQLPPQLKPLAELRPRPTHLCEYRGEIAITTVPFAPYLK